MCIFVFFLKIIISEMLGFSGEVFFKRQKKEEILSEYDEEFYIDDFFDIDYCESVFFGGKDGNFFVSKWKYFDLK